MSSFRVSLSSMETTALTQVQMGGSLDAEMRRAADRLIQLGLIDRTSRGLRVTPMGLQVSLLEAQRRGSHGGSRNEDAPGASP